MPDITAILSDPELGAATFTVERTVYRRTAGETSVQSRVLFPVTGCVHPGAPEQLAQLPEEDRHEEFIVLYAPAILSLGENHGITFTGPDVIHWHNQSWRLMRLKPWTAFGFVQGFAILIPEEEEGSG